MDRLWRCCGVESASLREELVDVTLLFPSRPLTSSRPPNLVDLVYHLARARIREGGGTCR
jgi:hypothetical protein